MVKSMTGFGQATKETPELTVQAEVRSLNSKFLDLNLRLPKSLADKEIEIRTIISDKLERGKVSVSIEFQKNVVGKTPVQINQELFKTYYQELAQLASAVHVHDANLFALALNLPEVLENKTREEINEQEWALCKEILNKALSGCEQHRQDEGNVLQQKFEDYINKIRIALQNVQQLDPKRVTRIREKLKGNVVSFFGEEGFDKNRLEQEIIFYIEKLDIQEEIVRLDTHLNYFNQILNEKNSNGKKLAFIAQEIGREINTIGSKSNDAEMQKEVVIMKEELEKIKEQLNNIV
ncbi:MAG: YicC/YloC family endoribonuclease [Chryseotalea sp.]